MGLVRFIVVCARQQPRQLSLAYLNELPVVVL